MIRDQRTGNLLPRKLRERRDVPGSAREITFSCFHRYRFLDSDRTREWFLEALGAARIKWPIDLWAYVIMPEHVHLLVRPRGDDSVSGFLRDVKEPVARKGIAFLAREAPRWLSRITVQEGDRTRRRFWQPGGGYDRNIVEEETLMRVIDYIHNNPVRRGLVPRAADWRWSSARWQEGLGNNPIDMDWNLTRP